MRRRNGTTWSWLAASMILAHGAVAEFQQNPTAVKQQYEAIMSRLDQGGDLLVIANVQGQLERAIGDLTQALAQWPAQDPDPQRIGDLARNTHAFLKAQGFYAVRGAGLSSVPLPGNSSRLKFFVSRDEAAAALPLWRGLVGGARRHIKGTKFLPQDTVLARTGTGEISQFWALVRQGVKELAPPETARQFDEKIALASAIAGVNIDTLIQSIGDEGFVTLQLSRTETVQIPNQTGQPITIPKPSLLMGLKLNNDMLPELIGTRLAAMGEGGPPITVVKAGATDVRALNIPIPMPIPIQPAYASHAGYFLIGSSAAVLVEAIAAFDNKNGWVATAEYKTAFERLPSENNGLMYVAPRFGEVLNQLQQTALSAGTHQDPAAAGFVNALMQMGGGPKTHSCALVILNLKDGILIGGASSGGCLDIVSGALVAPIGLLTAIAIPSFVSARSDARKSLCVNNMRLIEHAKEAYVISRNLQDTDPIFWKDIKQYVNAEEPLTCPQGGQPYVCEKPDGVYAGSLGDVSGKNRAVCPHVKEHPHHVYRPGQR